MLMRILLGMLSIQGFDHLIYTQRNIWLRLIHRVGNLVKGNAGWWIQPVSFLVNNLTILTIQRPKIVRISFPPILAVYLAVISCSRPHAVTWCSRNFLPITFSFLANVTVYEKMATVCSVTSFCTFIDGREFSKVGIGWSTFMASFHKTVTFKF